MPGVETELTFTTMTGGRYAVWAAEQVEGSWSPITSSPIVGDGFPHMFRDSNPTTRTRYYLVERLE